MVRHHAAHRNVDNEDVSPVTSLNDSCADDAGDDEHIRLEGKKLYKATIKWSEKRMMRTEIPVGQCL